METLWHVVSVLLVGFPIPPEMVDPRFPVLFQRSGGLVLTVLLTVASLVVGAAVGIVLTLCRRGPHDGDRPPAGLLEQSVQGAAIAVVTTVRGLPIMLLVLVLFYLPYPLTGLRLPGFVLAIAAFGLYAGAYLAESMRAGLRSVDPQLRAAGRVLGLTRTQILLTIELPLIYRTMLPDIINVAVTVFKDTSTLAIVAIPELTYTGRQLLMSEPVNYGLVLVIVLFSYWAPATALSAVALRAEQRRMRLEHVRVHET